MPDPMPPIPDDVRSAALELADARYVRDGAGASVTLGDSYDHDHPGGGEESLDRYYREEWAPRRVEEAWQDLREAFEAGGMTVWRNVSVAGDPLAAFRAHYREKGWVGIFWSTDRDQAHAHDSVPGEGVGVLLEAVATPDAVDWVATLASYAHPDWVGEEEVRLLPDAEVRLVSMCLREGWLRRSGDDAGVDIPLGDLRGAMLKAGDPDMSHGVDADVAGDAAAPAP